MLAQINSEFNLALVLVLFYCILNAGYFNFPGFYFLFTLYLDPLMMSVITENVLGNS